MNYTCKNCDWIGDETTIEYDTVDTCFGDDKIEMCPKCGSYEIKLMGNMVTNTKQN